MPLYKSKSISALEADPTKYRSQLYSPLEANPNKYRSIICSPLKAMPIFGFVNETHGFDFSGFAVTSVTTGYERFTTIPQLTDGTQNHITGNLLVVIIGYRNTTRNIINVTDIAGNSYIFIRRKALNQAIEFWYAKNILGNSANRITVTLDNSSLYFEVCVLQYSLVDTLIPFDISSDGSGYSPNQLTTPVDINYADELIVSGYNNVNTGTYTPETGFTFRYSYNKDLGSNYGLMGVEDKIVSELGSYGSTITFNQSTGYSAIHATFKKDLT